MNPVNCLKNLEAEIKEMWNEVNQSRQTQVTGEQPLVDPTNSVKFFTDKFDE